GRSFSSANSINWGRLLPQIVYYVWAYIQAVRRGRVRPGDEMNVVVPTGNFGNILAAAYARRMGLPLGRLICASNRNNVLSDFFGRGAYGSRRAFYLTMSPSMDILISSNFERYLFEVSGRDGDRVAAWFAELGRTGCFDAGSEVLARCGEEMWAGWCGEEETLASIREVFERYGYVLDPHSAVGYKVYQDYRRCVPEDGRYTVLASTASPFKFAGSVLKALDPGVQAQDEAGLRQGEASLHQGEASLHQGEASLYQGEASLYQGEDSALERLAALSGWEIPQCVQGIFAAESGTRSVCSVEGIPDVIRSVLI
ncbi:MAG: hypothetical protein FWG14_10545, partial [Peptococcaceae bacterium]|nr:hypothetical protein [Peptococcaceae bacterium]